MRLEEKKNDRNIILTSDTLTDFSVTDSGNRPCTAHATRITTTGKGELVHYYETCDSDGYSVKPENLAFQEYKKMLFSKLKDSLEITGFDVTALEHELLEPNVGRMTMFLPTAVVESRKLH